LKIPYLGPEVTEQLAAYDRSVVVGILGGGAGTTHDAFGLVEEAKRHGARVALFGRKINAAEHQLAFVKVLRAVADGQLAADEGVKAYHGELAKLGIRPHRSLADDLVRKPTVSAYAG
jgi:tetraacyldisaccharide-1-P 4'-kinase